MADRLFGAEPPNPPAELEEIKESYTAKIDWSLSLGETARYDYTPALETSFLYAANAEGDVIKIDAISGKELWKTNLGEAISGGVGTGGGASISGH